MTDSSAPFNMTSGKLNAIALAIAPHINRTPLLRASRLGDMLGCELWIKAELFQKTGSYKPRGMINSLQQLDEAARRRGVITFSAGNAAQGLAYAAKVFGIPAVAVMPANASAIKAEATRAYGAEVILHSTVATETLAHMHRLIAEHGYTFIAPGDHPDTINGNATIGLEILDDLPDVDLIMTPVGSGSVGAGLATACMVRGTATRIVGVNPAGAAAMHLSLKAGKPTNLTSPPNTIADGLAYPFGGQHTFPFFRDRVEEVVTCEDDVIREAMLLLMTRAKLYAEPSGAAGLAGLLAHPRLLRGARRVVCVVTGGNLDPARLKDLL
ncbi:MAG: threonine/serine dehydratase [Pseudolabrys sp.]|nr:threonine/serine dehydratase [Pseudolabrys sp.]